jgi:oxygen-independent coproporphyrinogen-3 oxidase
MDYQELIFDPQVIRRFDVNGPRYTSYPTADRFVEAFGADDYVRWLGKRTIGGIGRPLVIIRAHTPSATPSAITAPATR